MKNKKQQLQLNSLVFDHKTKRQGELISFSRDGGKTAQVSFIVKFDKKTGERTTKLETVETKNLSPSRKVKPKKYNPDEMYWMVREFQKLFGHPVANKPTQMDENRVQERYGYMLEELNEFKEAKTLVDQADALIDLMYFTLGSFVEMGVRPFNLFKIVQEANMGKLWEDGKPRYREEDGKIIKPPHWEERFAPEKRLKIEIERQSK